MCIHLFYLLLRFFCWQWLLCVYLIADTFVACHQRLLANNCTIYICLMIAKRLHKFYCIFRKIPKSNKNKKKAKISENAHQAKLKRNKHFVVVNTPQWSTVALCVERIKWYKKYWKPKSHKKSAYQLWKDS